ncbi:unnamed protein product [Lactuca virosa]|uniref:Uncharacterized protein n=1 Tax=Lactuca virosa TaxID=75947 RepID=A0AAU9PAG7_9ASTR|nr:unnamed protein product [Lactuca virosa]
MQQADSESLVLVCGGGDAQMAVAVAVVIGRLLARRWRMDMDTRRKIWIFHTACHSNLNSQRYSMTLKSKPAIIGLPKTQKMTYVESKLRQCKPANIRLFPKRSNSVGKAPTTVLVTEPSSPKVSCTGRVRSRRCRSRRKSSAQANQPEKSASQRSGTSRPHKAGFMSRITSLFRSEGHRRKKKGKSSEKSKNLQKIPFQERFT